MGFGQRPRGCICMRFALLEMKMTIYSVFSKFNLLPRKSTPEKIVLSPTANLPKARARPYPLDVTVE
jgi:cytochrome P450